MPRRRRGRKERREGRRERGKEGERKEGKKGDREGGRKDLKTFSCRSGAVAQFTECVHSVHNALAP